MNQQSITMISVNNLLTEVLKMKYEGYRLAAITCTSKNGMEMSYSFDKDYDLLSLRFITDTKTSIPSISIIYPYSFLYENEIRELFGVKIESIKPDFNDTLYKIPVKTPFHPTEKDDSL